MAKRRLEHNKYIRYYVLYLKETFYCLPFWKASLIMNISSYKVSLALFIHIILNLQNYNCDNLICRFVGNYGNAGLWDWLHGTDKAYKESIQAKRDYFLTSFTPVINTIPDVKGSDVQNGGNQQKGKSKKTK